MSLETLLKIGQLKTHPPDRDEIQSASGCRRGATGPASNGLTT